MEEGRITGFLVNTLDPGLVYEHMGYISGLSAFIPWFMVIFFTVRLIRESGDALIGKADLVNMLLSQNRFLVMMTLYISFGTLIFAVLLGMSELFQRFGSMSLIYKELVELKAQLFVDPETTKHWLETALEYTADIGNTINAGVTLLAYQGISIIFIFISQLIKILFAAGIVLVYGWGFIAITTMLLKGEMDLVKGWKINIATLFVWAIIEPIFLGIWSIVTWGGAEWIAYRYTGVGFGSTSLTMWYLFATVNLGACMVIKVISPFIAVKLVANQSFVSTLGAGAAVPATLLTNQLLNRLGGDANPMVSAFKDMMPKTGGNRGRDSLGDSMGDFLNKPLGDILKSVGVGGSRGGQSSMGDISDLDTSGNNDTPETSDQPNER